MLIMVQYSVQHHMYKPDVFERFHLFILSASMNSVIVASRNYTS